MGLGIKPLIPIQQESYLRIAMYPYKNYVEPFALCTVKLCFGTNQVQLPHFIKTGCSEPIIFETDVRGHGELQKYKETKKTNQNNQYSTASKYDVKNQKNILYISQRKTTVIACSGVHKIWQAETKER